MAALAAEVLAPLGTAGLIGMPNPGVTIPLDQLPLMIGESSVRGIVQGDAIPAHGRYPRATLNYPPTWTKLERGLTPSRHFVITRA